jgi:hypothetical protein
MTAALLEAALGGRFTGFSAVSLRRAGPTERDAPHRAGPKRRKRAQRKCTNLQIITATGLPTLRNRKSAHGNTADVRDNGQPWHAFGGGA